MGDPIIEKIKKNKKKKKPEEEVEDTPDANMFQFPSVSQMMKMGGGFSGMKKDYSKPDLLHKIPKKEDITNKYINI